MQTDTLCPLSSSVRIITSENQYDPRIEAAWNAAHARGLSLTAAYRYAKHLLDTGGV